MTYLGTISNSIGNRIDGYLIRQNIVELRATINGRFGVSYVTLPEWEQMILIDQSHQAYRRYQESCRNPMNLIPAITLA